MSPPGPPPAATPWRTVAVVGVDLEVPADLVPTGEQGLGTVLTADLPGAVTATVHIRPGADAETALRIIRSITPHRTTPHRGDPHA